MTVVPVTTVPAQYRKLSKLEEQVFLEEEILLVKDKIIYLMSDTQGVVSQSPEPQAHDKSV